MWGSRKEEAAVTGQRKEIMAPLRQGLRTNQIKKLVVRSLPGLAEGMRYQRSTFELVQKLKKLSADPRIQNQSEDEYLSLIHI